MPQCYQCAFSVAVCFMLLCVGFPFAMPAGPDRIRVAANLDMLYMHQRTACIRALCVDDAAIVGLDNSRHILYSLSDIFLDFFSSTFLRALYVDDATSFAGDSSR